MAFQSPIPSSAAYELEGPDDLSISTLDRGLGNAATDPEDTLPSLLPGEVIGGHYRVLRRLAAGSMGEVFEGEHLRLPRRLAIKVIDGRFAVNERALGRFTREAEVTARIDSVHVLDVLDLCRTPDGRPCIVSELLIGEDLDRYIKARGTLPASEVVALGIQMCTGVGAAHACGVFHRDLKPANLFLATQPGGGRLLKILDFGVAKAADSANLTFDGAVVGTPAYMAPEQAKGADRVNHRADIYGVGAVMYRLLSGRTPISGTSAGAALAKLISEGPASLEPRDDCPAALTDLINRCIAHDPDARYATIQCLRDALTTLAMQLGAPAGGELHHPVDGSHLPPTHGEDAPAFGDARPSLRIASENGQVDNTWVLPLGATFAEEPANLRAARSQAEKWCALWAATGGFLTLTLGGTLGAFTPFFEATYGLAAIALFSAAVTAWTHRIAKDRLGQAFGHAARLKQRITQTRRAYVQLMSAVGLLSLPLFGALHFFHAPLSNLLFAILSLSLWGVWGPWASSGGTRRTAKRHPQSKKRRTQSPKFSS